MRNLHVTGDIHCKNSRLVGGIAGENDGTIENCWVSANVRSDWKGDGYAKVGGIAGENNGTIEYCCMTGSVTNYDDNVAGIAGDNDDGKIKHCIFYGDLNRSTSSDYQNDNIYAGDSGTEENCFDFFNQSEYDAAAGKEMFRNAIKYPYAINVNNVGNGSVEVSIGGESGITRWRPSATVTVTKTSGTLSSITITDADGNTIALSGNEASGWTFTMPKRDVTVTAAYVLDDGTITINGGVVNATGGDYSAGIGGGYNNLHDIYYGVCGNIVINGGQVTAESDDDCAPSIGPSYFGSGVTNSGTLKLGWTNPDDFVYIGDPWNSGLLNDVARVESITFDKVFLLEGGTTFATAANIEGHKIVPYLPFTGEGTEGNPYIIASADDWNIHHRRLLVRRLLCHHQWHHQLRRIPWMARV